MNRRILLIDDTPSIHEDYLKILGPAADDALEDLEEALFGDRPHVASIHFEPESAFQGKEGLSKVQASLERGEPYAMAFVDMRMPPGWDGCETIRQIWQLDPGLQIVICTAYSDSSWEDVLATLDVRDRLLILKKPFDAIEVYQLACALTTKREMTRQAEQKLADLERLVEERMEEIETKNLQLEATNVQLSDAMTRLAALATIDELTGLENRRAFNTSLSAEFARAQRDESALSVVLFDIDHFKRYNDQHGHVAGDDVLQAIGRLLREQTRGSERVARYGGEEFVLVLPGLNTEGAVQVAERLRTAIAREPFPCEAVTASFGVATLHASLTTSLSLVQAADRALYASKARGRNRVTCFEGEDSGDAMTLAA